jgi:hypothetical protein
MTNRMNAAKRGAALERHARKCTICCHPEREDIEDEFLHWHFPNAIAVSFDLGDERVVYRHARATGLMAQRRDNCQAALDRIVEHADALRRVKADSIIRAIRAYSCLTESGRWVESPTQVVFSVVRPAAHTIAASKVPIAALPAAAREIARRPGPKRLRRANKSSKGTAANRKSGSKPEILIGGAAD